MSEAFIKTDPTHGGKIDCHKCGNWIYEDQEHVEFDKGVFFHEDCFNRYEHYYGLNKPID